MPKTKQTQSILDMSKLSETGPEEYDRYKGQPGAHTNLPVWSTDEEESERRVLHIFAHNNQYLIDRWFDSYSPAELADFVADLTK